MTTNMSLSDMITLGKAAFQLVEADVQQLRVPIDACLNRRRFPKLAVLVPGQGQDAQKESPSFF